MNITPKVILSNFRSFPISPVRESRFSLFFDFPPWGKSGFRCFLIFPHEGRPFSAVFLFSLVRESRFSLFSVHRTLRKPIFPVFRSSYPYESLFFLFFVHRTPTKAYFSRFPFIVPHIWTIFPENWWFTLVSGLIFPKTDDLLPYLNEFPEKRRKDHLSTQKRVLKWSFLIGLF